MKLTRKTSVVALFAAAALTLAACGSDEAATPSTSATAGSTAAVTTAATEAATGEATTSEAATEGSAPAETEGSATEGSAPAGTEGSAPAATGSVAPVGPVPAGTLAAAGASSQGSAMTAWIVGYNATTPDVTINYDAVGSGAGREQFLSGAVAFAGSDSALNDEELTTSQSICGPDGAIDIPVYISPIAIPFTLEGVSELNLSPSTLAKIFDLKIVKWNDAAIAADNPGVELPDTDIIAVNRSDESGTSKNFAQYLIAAAAADWPYEAADAWPVEGGEAAAKTAGVIDVVGSTNGAIGYADASAVGQIPTAAIKVGETFVKYTPEGAAAVVDESTQVEGRATNDLALSIARDTTTSGVYPIVLVSYHIACSTYTDATKGAQVKSFLEYVISEPGQAAAAAAAGSAPISNDLRTKVQAAVDSIVVG